MKAPMRPFFVGVGATETPETVWESRNENRRSVSLFYATDVGFIVVRLFMRLFPLKPDSDLQTLNGEVNGLIIGASTGCVCHSWN